MCSLYISYNRYHGVFRKVLFVAVLFWSRVVHADLAVHATVAALCSGRDSCMLTSRCMLPWYHTRIWVAGWYQVHTCWYKVRASHMMWFLPADTRYIRIWNIIRTPHWTKISRVSHTKTKISRTHRHTRTDFFGGMYQLEIRFPRITMNALSTISCFCA